MDRRELLAIMLAAPVLAGAGSPLPATAQPADRRSIMTADGRRLEVSIFGRQRGSAAPIIFSHGHGSAPRYYDRMIAAWTAAGHQVMAPLHVDSPDNILNQKTRGADVWATRLRDLRAVSAMVRQPYVAAGHSYGALTALAMIGANAIRPSGVRGPLTDPLATRALAFSPPGYIPSLIPVGGYASLVKPAFVQTGTLDIPAARKNDPDGWRDHLAAFAEARPSQNHWALVLDAVDHYFGGLICDNTKTGAGQEAALDLALSASLAFISEVDRVRAGRSSAQKVVRPHFTRSARFYTK